MADAPTKARHKQAIQPIMVDIDALRRARTEQVLERAPVEIKNIAEDFERLNEFSLLSRRARQKSQN